MKIIFGDKYLSYRFGIGHPFLSRRRQEFIDLLRVKKFDFELIEPPKAKDEDILLVHTKVYLYRLKKMVEAGGGYISLDTPINSDNFEAAYYYVGGTIRASEIALKEGLAINTLGGLHHAESNNSSGFCIFNDHAIAIRRLQKHKKIKTAAVLDLDVHAGNGTQEIFYDDPSVLKISLHQDPTNFYPGTGFSWQKGLGGGEGFNINYPLPFGTTESGYLPVLDEAIERIKDFKPDILFVVFGVDTFKNDQLGGLKLEKETYGKISTGLKKLRTGEIKNLSMVILFAGGYSISLPELWWGIVSNLV